MFKSPTQKSDLYDYNGVHIVVKRRTTVEGSVANNRTNKKLTFKNNALFKSTHSLTSGSL